ncbi:hypothetical protein [Pseudomonas sp. NPDC087614]|uniref:hypothetical protein n=1 Tax=Pseudomonas sp. NPDC087614 TaxID=3364442 RepID=UPI003804EAF3
MKTIPQGSSIRLDDALEQRFVLCASARCARLLLLPKLNDRSELKGKGDEAVGRVSKDLGKLLAYN